MFLRPGLKKQQHKLAVDGHHTKHAKAEEEFGCSPPSSEGGVEGKE